jgi:hypothetical protein
MSNNKIRQAKIITSSNYKYAIEQLEEFIEGKLVYIEALPVHDYTYGFIVYY